MKKFIGFFLAHLAVPIFALFSAFRFYEASPLLDEFGFDSIYGFCACYGFAGGIFCLSVSFSLAELTVFLFDKFISHKSPSSPKS